MKERKNKKKRKQESTSKAFLLPVSE